MVNTGVEGQIAPLDEHGAIAEGREGLAGGPLELLGALLDVVDDPHPAAPAAVGSLGREVGEEYIGRRVHLEDDGAAVLGDEGHGLLRRGDGLVCPGDDGQARGDGGLPGCHLVWRRWR